MVKAGDPKEEFFDKAHNLAFPVDANALRVLA